MDKSNIDQLFNRLSKRYDFFCPLFSFGIDLLWRKKLISMIPKKEKIRYLDIACGTGALINDVSLNRHGHFTGIDLSPEMLSVAKEKQHGAVSYLLADAQNLPFADQSFDITTNAFGLRNFSDYQMGLRENYRILNKGGTALFLELGIPQSPFILWFYRLYLHTLIPLIGQFIVNDPRSWKYLGTSIENFAKEVDLEQQLRQTGFSEVASYSLTFGIARIYRAIK